LGYHPYFQLHAAPRDEWKVNLAARSRWVLSDKLIPTGEKQPVRNQEVTLKDTALDDVFGDLQRGPDGLARFGVNEGSFTVTVNYSDQTMTIA
jgi:galactose mutarotase-like enzyme